MVALGLNEAQGQCTFDFKPLGSGVLGNVSRESLISSYFKLKYSKKHSFSYNFNVSPSPG